MNKRDLIFSLLDPAKTPEIVPAAFFLHFDPAYHTGPGAVAKHLEFFRYTGMDIAKIQFELGFPQMEVNTPADWAKLPFFGLDHYQPMLALVKGVVAAAKAEAPVILTLYSPYMLTNNIAGEENVARTMGENPQAYQRAIGQMTDSLMAFVKEAIRLGLDGFYTSTQGGEKGRLPDPALFNTCVRPYDLAIMEEINQNCPFTILHICDYHSPYDDIYKFTDYPGQVVNVSLDLVGGEVTARDVAAAFKRPFMGGLERKGVIATGTPEQIRAAVQQAVDNAPERYILGADCTIPADTSWDNLKLAIQTAHECRRGAE